MSRGSRPRRSLNETCQRSRPVVAFTSGDPAGIGPEVVLGAWPALARICRPVLVGEASVWRRAGVRPGSGALHDTGLGLRPPEFGRPAAAGGALAFAAVQAAVRLAERGLVGAVVERKSV
ncbi:MAG: hypothetical protein PHF00_03565, partial [Elusimicrobia bacterium]|nr:hypothetical protein [Elusimicrobiota bacterium]